MQLAFTSEAATIRQPPKETNRLRVEDSAVHDWYRFVLSFPPHLVRDYLDRFGINRGQVVLDPFCGTGTTLVECKKLGIRSVGIEANPMPCFASRVKTDWEVNARNLLEHAEAVAATAKARLEDQGLTENSDLPLLAGRSLLSKLRKLDCLEEEIESLLLTGSISPIPLHRTLTLLRVLEEFRNKRFEDYERLALAKALVSEIGNLEFGPEVGVGTPKSDAPVVSIWLNAVRRIVCDVEEVIERPEAPAHVYHADSRDAISALGNNSISAVITSPPYPNEKDYTRTTRLESVLLGFIKTKDDLRALKRQMIRSNTRGVYKEDSDDELVKEHPEISRIADAIEKRRIELGKTSGFERLYARVTRLYFGGMMRHLAALRPKLHSGAQLAYVVGDQASYLRVMIRTGQLLADIAQSLGYELAGIDLFRTRLATATREQLREEVVLLRWPGGKA